MTIIIRNLGLKDYSKVLLAMHNFIENRNIHSKDELWLVQHYNTFTKGKNSNFKDLLKFTWIPIIDTDRGGKITFHGPGQQIFYFLLDLKRNNLSIKNLVSILESIVISTLSYFYIKSHRINSFPGVYVDNKKICSLGLRIVRGYYTMHGLSINVNMNLNPFYHINPCGNNSLKVTQIKDFVKEININDVIDIFLLKFFEHFNFSKKIFKI